MLFLSSLRLLHEKLLLAVRHVQLGGLGYSMEKTVDKVCIVLAFGVLHHGVRPVLRLRIHHDDWLIVLTTNFSVLELLVAGKLVVLIELTLILEHIGLKSNLLLLLLVLRLDEVLSLDRHVICLELKDWLPLYGHSRINL